MLPIVCVLVVLLVCATAVGVWRSRLRVRVPDHVPEEWVRAWQASQRRLAEGGPVADGPLVDHGEPDR